MSTAMLRRGRKERKGAGAENHPGGDVAHLPGVQSESDANGPLSLGADQALDAEVDGDGGKVVRDRTSPRKRSRKRKATAEDKAGDTEATDGAVESDGDESGDQAAESDAADANDKVVSEDA